MSNAPSDRHLSHVIRDLAWGNLQAGTQRVMFLGPRGEVREVIYPNQGGRDSLLAKRAELLESKELSAAVYLGCALIPDMAQINLVEAFAADGTRTVHALFTVPDTYRWFIMPEQKLDQWLSTFEPKGDEAPGK